MTRIIHRLPLILLLLAYAQLQTGCDSQGADSLTDGGEKVATGALLVKVTNSRLEPVADAVVTTMPNTTSVVTDALGSVFLDSIPVGSYAVTAVHPTSGAGRSVVTITAGAIAQLSIVLSAPSPSLPGAPTVQILSPSNGTILSVGSAIQLSALIHDEKDAAVALHVSVISSIDGVLTTPSIAADGTINVSVKNLSVGSHLLSVKATDSDGLSTTASVVVTVKATGGADAGGQGGRAGIDAGPLDSATGPDNSAASLLLESPTKDPNGINLSWKPTGTFSMFKVTRAQGSSAFAVIDIVSGKQAYRDDKVQSGITYSYRVIGIPSQGGEVSSNVVTITAGAFIDVGSQVEVLMADRTRPYLYALDRVNNSLRFVNTTTNLVEKTIFVGSTPTAMDVNAANSELYIANFGSTEIAVVDLNTREKARTMFVDTTKGTWDGNPYRIACTAGNTLVFTSEDQWNNLKLVNALTGAHLDVQGSIYEPHLASTPDGNSLYAIESGISTVGIVRYDVIANKLVQVDENRDVGSYSNNNVLVSRDGKYVFAGSKKFLAKNLKSILGTFGEGIQAINKDGSVAIGAKNVFDGNTFGIIKPLPISTPVMTLGNDDKTLYLYDQTSSRIYIWAVN